VCVCKQTHPHSETRTRMAPENVFISGVSVRGNNGAASRQLLPAVTLMKNREADAASRPLKRVSLVMAA